VRIFCEIFCRLSFLNYFLKNQPLVRFILTLIFQNLNLILDLCDHFRTKTFLKQLTIYSAGLAFWLRLNCIHDPALDFRAAYHLGAAKSAAIWVCDPFARNRTIKVRGMSGKDRWSPALSPGYQLNFDN